MNTALLALALPGLVFAANSYPYSMTGEQLVRKFSGPPGVKYPATAYDTLDRETARGFLDGVKDATQGHAWCYKGSIKQIELDMDVVGRIASMPAREQRQAAGPLVVRVLSESYPCKGGAKMKPSLAALILNYPGRNVQREVLFSQLGWQSILNDSRFADTCAIRMSVALIRSGMLLPEGGMVIQSGALKGRRVETGQAKLSHYLKRHWGDPEVYKGGEDVARKGIGRRGGVVSFFKIHPSIAGLPAVNQGHIDLVEEQLGPAWFLSDCKMQCYFGAVETWFWHLA